MSDLFKPHIALGSFLLRLGLASIFVFHGSLKLAKGATSWHPELTEMSQQCVAWGELVCGLVLLFGLLSRVAVLGIIVIQVGAIVVETGREAGQWGLNIDYLAPGAAYAPLGPEYNIALIIMCLAVLALGSGKISLDYLLFGAADA